MRKFLLFLPLLFDGVCAANMQDVDAMRKSSKRKKQAVKRRAVSAQDGSHLTSADRGWTGKIPKVLNLISGGTVNLARHERGERPSLNATTIKSMHQGTFLIRNITSFFLHFVFYFLKKLSRARRCGMRRKPRHLNRQLNGSVSTRGQIMSWWGREIRNLILVFWILGCTLPQTNRNDTLKYIVFFCVFEGFVFRFEIFGEAVEKEKEGLEAHAVEKAEPTSR